MDCEARSGHSMSQQVTIVKGSLPSCLGSWGSFKGPDALKSGVAIVNVIFAHSLKCKECDALRRAGPHSTSPLRHLLPDACPKNAANHASIRFCRDRDSRPLSILKLCFYCYAKFDAKSATSRLCDACKTCPLHFTPVRQHLGLKLAHSQSLQPTEMVPG